VGLQAKPHARPLRIAISPARPAFRRLPPVADPAFRRPENRSRSGLKSAAVRHAGSRRRLRAISATARAARTPHPQPSTVFSVCGRSLHHNVSLAMVKDKMLFETELNTFVGGKYPEKNVMNSSIAPFIRPFAVHFARAFNPPVRAAA
jgi:hypothetical protein